MNDVFLYILLRAFAKTQNMHIIFALSKSFNSKKFETKEMEIFPQLPILCIHFNYFNSHNLQQKRNESEFLIVYI